MYLKNKEAAMNVSVKCFSTLVNPETCDYKNSTDYDLADNQTVGDLLNHANISQKDVKIAFVNGRIVNFDTVLSNGDQVGLAPAVGGM
jgi:sulfur carrier protein ThiS